MKKVSYLLIMLLIITTISFTYGNTSEVNSDYIKVTIDKFSDVSQDHWFAKTVAKLVEKGGIAGYSDGTFKPNREITQAELIKIVVASIHQELPLAQKEHWSMNYIRKARELGYIDAGEYPEGNLNNIINRYQMAKIIVRAAEAQGEAFKDNRSEYSSQIKDYNNIPEAYRDIVLKAYTQGLLGGYPDGEYKGNRGLTRAEASTAIVRIFDAEERLTVKEIGKNVEVIEGITFDRDNDINTSRSNSMRLDKQEEFVMLFFNSLKFYNKEGKSYLSGYVPNLPEGYEWNIDIRVRYADETRDSYSYDVLYERTNRRVLIGEDFQFQLSGNREKLDSIIINAWIMNSINGAEDGRFFMYYPEKELIKYDKINKNYIEFDWEGMLQW